MLQAPQRVPERTERTGLPSSHLEAFSYEEGCMGKLDSAVPHVDLATRYPPPRLVEHELEPLRGLFDGLVVEIFSGCRFFTVDA